MHCLTRLSVVFLALACNTAFADSITIGAEDDAAPWSYADGTGYVNDLVKAAYAAVGWEVKYHVLPYPRCKFMTEEGTLPGCFSASNTAETSVGMQFPNQPVFSAHNVLFAREDSPLKGCHPEDWGHPISVAFVKEYEYGDSVVKLQKSGDIKSEVVTSEAFSLRMLAARRIDAALITVDEVNRIELVATLAGVKNRFKKVCDFGGEPAFLGISRKHPKGAAALDAFNRGMAILAKNGTITKLQTAWAKKAIELEAAKNH